MAAKRKSSYGKKKGLKARAREGLRFNGSDCVAEHDQRRLTGQILRVYSYMRDGVWRTLGEIEAGTGDPAASVSAQLRHLRKVRFGAHTINKRSRSDRDRGLYEYRLEVNE